MKFRKKPIVIEAYQTDKELIVPTLEGPLRAAPGEIMEDAGTVVDFRKAAL